MCVPFTGSIISESCMEVVLKPTTLVTFLPEVTMALSFYHESINESYLYVREHHVCDFYWHSRT